MPSMRGAACLLLAGEEGQQRELLAQPQQLARAPPLGERPERVRGGAPRRRRLEHLLRVRVRVSVRVRVRVRVWGVFWVKIFVCSKSLFRLFEAVSAIFFVDG